MMKRYILVLLFACATLSTSAQSDAGAKKMLDAVAKKYDSYSTAQADFGFLATDTDNKSYSDQGTLYLNKGKNQYQIKLQNQQLISDGHSVWTVLREEKEIQITDAENSTDAIGPNNLFTFYRTGFKYIGMSDETVGSNTLSVIEMAPLDAKKNYFKIKVRINKNKHIHDVSIYDKSGSKYTYTIQKLYVNHQIPSSRFVFNKKDHPGFEVVDLR
ncbi:outer membrane lipoprotein carrier protein LolA [Sphingobacterium olei]|uniref:Outer membrane lipoprotein carrier protein LolA n=1 Tax=Sphingobacterium olei TaxID=2571155 RepID=A0A4V5MMT0_9SPHI|nr:outer membrane lipoprotein carrier protein LolA [Sphingobacterium olei]TJZ61318.1 outer membrane lipoprotein carrier protein LolA [Sphingobacterium olei]